MKRTTEVGLLFLGGAALVAVGWQPGVGQPGRPVERMSWSGSHRAVVVGNYKEP